MPRVTIDPAMPDQMTLDVEIARLRDLDVSDLRARWQTAFGQRPPPHLPRHLLFRMLAYSMQADLLGDLDGDSKRLLDGAASPEAASKRAIEVSQVTVVLPYSIACDVIRPQKTVIDIIGSRPPNASVCW